MLPATNDSLEMLGNKEDSCEALQEEHRAGWAPVGWGFGGGPWFRAGFGVPGVAAEAPVSVSLRAHAHLLGWLL